MTLIPVVLSLPADEVHLWYGFTDQPLDSTILDRFSDVLSPDERERLQRFTFEEGRRQYLYSHGFLRHVLSQYADIPADALRFTRSAYGKPRLTFEDDDPHAALRSLSFNLTHTYGLTALTVAWDRELGIDAEQIDRRGREIGEHLIDRCLSPEEKRAFELVPPQETKSGFFDYWTLKEAYLKARGFGLTLPIEQITFWWPGSPHEGRVAARFGDAIGDDPAYWQFERFLFAGTHRLALAIRRVGGPDLVLHLFEYPREIVRPL